MEIILTDQNDILENQDNIKLQNFNFLTGINGCGKTRLLKAIDSGNVKIKYHHPNSHYHPDDIIYFCSNDFQIKDTSKVSAKELETGRNEAWEYLDNNRRQHNRFHFSKDQMETLKTYYKNTPFLENTGDMYHSAQKDIIAFLNDENNQFSSCYKNIQKILPYSILDISWSNFFALYEYRENKEDVIIKNISSVFWQYYTSFEKNKYERRLCKDYPKQNNGRNFLSDEEFTTHKGYKPWELVNNILKKHSNLPYIISSPEGLDCIIDTYQAKLIHTQDETIEIQFDSLSSGEKILLSLVIAIYQNQQDGNFPKLILLDEIDASMHPSMIRKILEILNDVFIENGTKIIFSTHSATTISYADENSVFVIKDKILSSTTKAEAIDCLSEGLITLEKTLTIFDQLAHRPLNIISEGNNYNYLKKAINFYAPEINDKIHFIEGFEHKTGESQLKSIYSLMLQANLENKLMLIYDPEVTVKDKEIHNVIPYAPSKNDNNTICKKGIENLFSTELINKYLKVEDLGNTKLKTDKKRDFEKYVLDRNNKEDFKKFEPIIEQLKDLIN